jgi:hypothetical protein
MGWVVPDRPEMGQTFDCIASPAHFGPTYGDPIAAAITKAARIFDGTYELTPCARHRLLRSP